MDKFKLLSISVVLLLLINLGMLFYIIRTPHNNQHERRHHESPKNIIIQKLQFDEAQQQEYEKQIHWHRKTILNLEHQIHQTKNRLYLNLTSTQSNIKQKDSLIHQLGNLQMRVETTHFKHFQDIKSICKPNQLERFNALTKELASLFAGPKHKHPKPRSIE